MIRICLVENRPIGGALQEAYGHIKDNDPASIIPKDIYVNQDKAAIAYSDGKLVINEDEDSVTINCKLANAYVLYNNSTYPLFDIIDKQSVYTVDLDVVQKYAATLGMATYLYNKEPKEFAKAIAERIAGNIPDGSGFVMIADLEIAAIKFPTLQDKSEFRRLLARYLYFLKIKEYNTIYNADALTLAEIDFANKYNELFKDKYWR